MSIWILNGGFYRNVKCHHEKEIIFDHGDYANQGLKTLSEIFGTFILHTLRGMFKSIW